MTYWTEVCLYGDAVGENPHEKLTCFSQHIM